MTADELYYPNPKSLITITLSYAVIPEEELLADPNPNMATDNDEPQPETPGQTATIPKENNKPPASTSTAAVQNGVAAPETPNTNTGPVAGSVAPQQRYQDRIQALNLALESASSAVRGRHCGSSTDSDQVSQIFFSSSLVFFFLPPP